MSSSTLRSRWAAIGAAVAVCLGAGGVGISQATTSTGEMPIYISINPCRMADTRPAPDNVGPRTTPLGANETYTLDGRGTSGDCTLPSRASGLALNVTAVGPTNPTFLRLWPADGAQPTTSNLNPVPGQPPTPNMVNVGLSATGEFNVLNRFGTVDVIIDVVGYYEDHIHRSVDLVDEPGVVYTFEADPVAGASTATAVVQTKIRPPADGYVAVEVTGLWRPDTPGIYDSADCQLQKGTPTTLDKSEPWFRLDDQNTGTAQRYTGFSAHRVMPIAVADNVPIGVANSSQTISLVCDESAGNITFTDVHLSATYYATSYAPLVFTPV